MPQSEGGAGVDVINTSLGDVPLPRARGIDSFFEHVVQEAADFALEHDVVWTSSAGNESTNLTREDRTYIPASADGIVSVSATGPIGNLWGSEQFDVPSDELAEPFTEPAVFTNHGQDDVHVSAPGGNFHEEALDAGVPGSWWDLVLSTYPLDQSGFPATGLNLLAGTSMSAPNVAGEAALIRSEYPELSASEVVSLIRRTADDVGHATWHGDGFINPVAAIEGEAPEESRQDRSDRGTRDDRGRERGDDGGSGGGGSSGRGDGDDDGSSRGR